MILPFFLRNYSNKSYKFIEVYQHTELWDPTLKSLRCCSLNDASCLHLTFLHGHRIDKVSKMPW